MSGYDKGVVSTEVELAVGMSANFPQARRTRASGGQGWWGRKWSVSSPNSYFSMPSHLISSCAVFHNPVLAKGQRMNELSQRRQLATILSAVRAVHAPQCDIPRFTNAADGGESGS